MDLTMVIERRDELERRVLAGTDDFAYCLRWIAIHQRIIDARQQGYPIG